MSEHKMSKWPEGTIVEQLRYEWHFHNTIYDDERQCKIVMASAIEHIESLQKALRQLLDESKHSDAQVAQILQQNGIAGPYGTIALRAAVMQAEKALAPKWCAMCGKWGDHTSGTCPQFDGEKGGQT